MQPTRVDLERKLRRASAWIAWLSVLVGSLVWVGWASGNMALKTLVLSPTTMKPNAAMCFIFAGLALLFLLPKPGRREWRFWVGRGSAFVIALVGLLTVSEYALGISLGLDHILFHEAAGAIGAYPGRIGLIGAWNFLFMGAALFLLDVEGWRGSRPFQLLAVLIALGGVLGILEVALGPDYAHPVTSLPSSATHFLMAFGLLFARPNQGLMKIIVSAGPGGALARKLLPVAVAIPLLIGWLRWQGQRAGWYGTAAGICLITIVSLALLCILVLWMAGSLEETDAARRRAVLAEQRASRALETLSQANAAVVHAKNEEELLRDVCRIAVEAGGYRLAWVGIPEHDEARSVRPVAHAGAGADYVAAAQISWADVPRGRGPTGIAIRTRQVQIAHNLRTDPAFEPWRAAAARYGFASSIVLPLLDDATVLGALNIYATELDAFDVQEVELLEDLGTNLAYGLVALRQHRERERAEQALQRSEKRYRSLVLATSQMVWSTGPDGLVHQPLPTWQQFTGQSDAEVLGVGWAQALHPDDVERTRKIWEEAVHTHCTYDAEYRVRRADGEYRYFAARGVPVLAEDQSIEEWIGTCTDITQRKQAEEDLARHAEELKRSNQELEDFATVASHDLQEPLRKIGAFGERLSQRCAGALDERGRDYLERMLSAARRMSELINSLLAFSRIIRKGREFEPTNLNTVAAEVLADLESRIEEENAEMTVGPLPTLLADPVQMRQLLQNLVSNALKFRKSEGAHRVTVACQPQENGFWEIHVTDNGIGFDEIFLDRIFKPFQRLHGRGEYEGHGMGLAVCTKIVRRHGGQITAHSRPGQGSDFVVALPRFPNEEKSWRPKTAERESQTCSSSSPKMMMTISR